MPKITKIMRQKKNDGRLSVFVDGKFSFGCSEDVFASLDIHDGDILTLQRLDEISEVLGETTIRHRALGYLSRRARSIEEMRKYLAEKGFVKEQIAATIEWLRERNYLNDAEFADQWIKTRLQLAPRGRQKLLLELYQKGIDKSTANKAIAENLGKEDEAEAAYQVLLQRKKRYAGMERLEIKKKIYNFLSYRGFSGDAVMEASERFLKEFFI
jgi:regulatory protein